MDTAHFRQLMIVVTFLVAVCAHVFVVRWLLRVFPLLARRRRAVVWTAVALFMTAPVGRLCGVFYWKGLAATLQAVGTMFWMWVILAAMPLAVVVVLVRFVLPRVRPLAPAPRRDPAEPSPSAIGRREAVERAAGIAAFGASATALGWGAVLGRHEFAIEELVVRVPGLPRVLDGYTIAQVSDLHGGLFVGDREIDEGLVKVRSLRPDLVVATGDLLDFDARYAPWLARKLADLMPRDGVFGILGNHDYYAGFRLVLPAMRAAGVTMLVNDGQIIRPGDGGGFALLGVDDLWASRSGGIGPSLDRAIGMVRPDAARILLAHQPNFFTTARGKVALQLSGHTHGGQINPGFRPAELFMRYLAGRYDEGASTLWVNRGFGVAGPPSRIGAPPEVTKVVLVSA